MHGCSPVLQQLAGPLPGATALPANALLALRGQRATWNELGSGWQHPESWPSVLVGGHRCIQTALPDRRRALLRVVGTGPAAVFGIACRLAQQVANDCCCCLGWWHWYIVCLCISCAYISLYIVCTRHQRPKQRLTTLTTNTSYQGSQFAPIGHHNITVTFGGAFAGAAAHTASLPTLINPTTSRPYHLQVFPVVASVAPPSVPCSGAVVTITGAGFPPAVDGNEASSAGLHVRIGGAPCTVAWSNGTALQCTAWQHPRYAQCAAGGGSDATSSVDGMVAGVLWETFAGVPGVDVDAWMGSLPPLHTPSRLVGVLVRVVDTDNFTLPWELRGMATRGSAMLTVPVTGAGFHAKCGLCYYHACSGGDACGKKKRLTWFRKGWVFVHTWRPIDDLVYLVLRTTSACNSMTCTGRYRFGLVASGMSVLTAIWQGPSGRALSATLTSTPGNQGSQQPPGQVSQPLLLMQGQPMLLQVYMLPGNSQGGVQVGVFVPGGTTWAWPLPAELLAVPVMVQHGAWTGVWWHHIAMWCMGGFIGCRAMHADVARKTKKK